MTNSTSLSLTRIFITLAIFFVVPYAADAADLMLNNLVISRTLALNTCAIIVILLNFDVLQLHARRLKENIFDAALFTLLAALLCAAVTLINKNWLLAEIWSFEMAEMSQYSFFFFTMLIAYSFSFSFSFILAFKAITDRFKVRVSEKLIIVFSGVLFGAFMALSMAQSLNPSLLLRMFGYYFLISVIASYTYNQTHSLLPMGFGYGLVLLIALL